MPTSAIAGSVLPLRRAEELIATLPGVLSVRIVPGDTGAIDEVHVLTTAAVAPKQTVRNIESALIAQLGLRVNHRKISIATSLDQPRAFESSQPAQAVPSAPVLQASPSLSIPAARAPHTLGSNPPQPMYAPSPAQSSPAAMPLGFAAKQSMPIPPLMADVLPSGRRALVFEGVEVRRSRLRGVTCRVTLSQGDQEFSGEAEGQESERSRVDLAARATVLAIVESFRDHPAGERALSLEGSTLIAAFNREYVFVGVTGRAGREGVALTGSCEVRDNSETSAVLAVLDATNRWLHAFP